MDESERFRAGTHVCKPFRYRRGHRKPKTLPKKSVVLGLECALREPADPQQTDFQLTGVYECDQGESHGGLKNFTLCVNHAGSYVSLWLSRFDDTEVVRLVGRAETVPSFSLFEPFGALDPKATPVGFIGVSDGKGLVLYLDPGVQIGVGRVAGSFEFERVATKKTLSDRAVERLPKAADADIARLLEHAPIPTSYRRRIVDALSSNEFDGLLQSFFEQEIRAGSLNNGARLAVEDLDDYLDREFKPILGWRLAPAVLRRALTQFAVLTLKTRAATIMRSTTIVEKLEHGKPSYEITRSRYEWLLDTLSLVSDDSFSPKPSLRWIVGEGRLGLGRRDTELRFAYEFVFDGEGFAGDAGVGVQIFTGTLKVRQLEPTESTTAMELKASLYGYSGGLSAGFQSAKGLKGVGRANRSWSEPDFLTAFSAYENGSQASVGGGKAVGPSSWVLNPPPGAAPMTVDFAETSLHGVSAGLEFGSGWGVIRKDDRTFEAIVEESEKIETRRYEARFGGAERAHFALGSSLLTSEGKRLVGFLAANELASLSPSVRVVAA